MSISANNKNNLTNITSTLQSINQDANEDQSVRGDDARFDEIQGEIGELLDSKCSNLDDATKAKLTNMKNDVANLQTLASYETESTQTSNSSWQMLTADINGIIADISQDSADPLNLEDIPASAKILNGDVAGGVGVAYKYLTDEQAKKAGLPPKVAEAQKTQQVNKIDTGNGPIYVTSSNSNPITYDVYDANDNKLNKDPLQKFALGLNDGKSWLKINEGGIARSVSITTDELKSLPSDTQLYDLNGMGDSKQLVDRGKLVS